MYHHQVLAGPCVIQEVLKPLLTGIRQDAGYRIGYGINPSVLETDQGDDVETDTFEFPRAGDGHVAVAHSWPGRGLCRELFQQVGEVGRRQPDGAGGALRSEAR